MARSGEDIEASARAGRGGTGPSIDTIRRNRWRSERYGGEKGRDVHRVSVTFSSRRAIAIEARAIGRNRRRSGRHGGEEGRDIDASARAGAEC